jgi:hypothetical protein
MGNIAADRHVKINKFILAVDGSQDVSYPTHDFTAGYKCFVCGILLIVLLSYHEAKDQHGLPRLISDDDENVLYGTVRFNKFRGAERVMTMLEHYDDLCDMWKQAYGSGPTPSSCLIFSDHGGDANFFTVKALYSLAKFMKAQKIDLLWMTGPASNCSARNLIERRWALPKKALAGMALPEKLNGDTVAPNQQADILRDVEALGAKELEIFTVAGESVCAALNDIDGNCKYKTRYLLPEVPFHYYFINLMILISLQVINPNDKLTEALKVVSAQLLNQKQEFTSDLVRPFSPPPLKINQFNTKFRKKKYFLMSYGRCGTRESTQ